MDSARLRRLINNRNLPTNEDDPIIEFPHAAPRSYAEAIAAGATKAVDYGEGPIKVVQFQIAGGGARGYTMMIYFSDDRAINAFPDDEIAVTFFADDTMVVDHRKFPWVYLMAAPVSGLTVKNQEK